VLEKQREEERLREELDGKELKNFRQAVQARESAIKPPPLTTAPSSSSLVTAPKPSTATAIPKKESKSKKALKGVLVKKKPKPALTAPQRNTSTASKSNTEVKTEKGVTNASKNDTNGDDEPPQSKRRRLDPE